MIGDCHVTLGALFNWLFTSFYSCQVVVEVVGEIPGNWNLESQSFVSFSPLEIGELSMITQRINVGLKAVIRVVKKTILFGKNSKNISHPAFDFGLPLTSSGR